MSEKPLSNRKLEIVAQHLAKGATAAEASIAAKAALPFCQDHETATEDDEAR